MVSLNARIQRKYDLSGSDFSTRRYHGKHILYLLIFTLSLITAGAVWS